MMGKTHWAIGMAASLAVSFSAVQPQNLSDNLIALAGGAVGGVLAGCDILDDDYKYDALIGQLLGLAVLGIVVALDWFLKLGVCEYVVNQNRTLSIAAGIAFCILYIVGCSSDHRTFTHSLLAMALFAGCFTAVYPRMGFAVLVGYASHLLLDLLNKKEVPLLYPLKKGICFDLCYAKGAGNTFLMFIGLIATLGLLGYRLYPYIFH